MSKIDTSPRNRVKFDNTDKVLRSFFNSEIRGNVELESHKTMNKTSLKNFAQETLEKNADKIFKSPEDLKNIKELRITEGVNNFSARFLQEFKEVPVHDSEIVVNFNSNGDIQSLYNNYRYDIPSDLDPKNIKISKDQAIRIVEDLSKAYKERYIDEPTLVIYKYTDEMNLPPRNTSKPFPVRDQFLFTVNSLLDENKNKGIIEEKYFLVWDITLTTKNPVDKWKVLVDAYTGHVISVIDLKQYISKGLVFDPNPAVTTGDLSLSPSSPTEVLDAQAINVDLQRLDPPQNGKYFLDGRYVKMLEIESPNFVEPSETSGDFLYSCRDRRFLNVMCYYHIDCFQNYIQNQLRLFNVCNFPLEVDPQGFNEDDNSHYMPPGNPGNPINRPYLGFGEGGVRDAEDAQVILHEYGHAIQDNCNPGFNNPRSGLGEGFGDLLAAIYYDDKHHESRTRGLMFSWDAAPFGAGPWPGRKYNMNWYFDSHEYTSEGDNHITGQLWCATIFELYRKLGGDSKSKAIRQSARDITLRLHLMANFNIPTINAKAFQAALEIEAANNNLAGWKYPNGIHRKVIYDVFSRRHLDQFTPKEVDIYIDDGRNGGYGSMSGQDQFTESLWKEEYWDTQDIWNKNIPYLDDTSKSNGSSADHEGPIVGTETHLYVKIKNKGSNISGSGKASVQAYRSIKGKESKFEEDWTSIGTLTVPNILPRQSNGTIVGPFRYTPEKENEAVMIIVECDSDPSIIKNINSSISCQDFVPFDNNIGMRLV